MSVSDDPSAKAKAGVRAEAKAPSSPSTREEKTQGAAKSAPAEEGTEGAGGRESEAKDAGFGDAVALRTSGDERDGAVEIRVAEDWMSATAAFFPPRDDGRPLTRDMVATLLSRLGVRDCVLWDLIDESILACNLDRHYMRDVVVARGIPPEDSMPSHGAIDPRFAPKARVASEDEIKVDFRELASLPVVKKGEVVGRMVEGSEGRLGKDLQGRELAAPRGRHDDWKAGKNIVVEEGLLKAAVDGLLLVGDFSLAVEEVFIVKGGVDYHTGHIVFPGDVIIEGKVSDGFKVWSGASIQCKSTLDAFDVNAKKDLLCQQGIIGHHNGRVRVGGRLQAKFIENCKVASRGDISVVSAIMGSSVYTLGSIELGERGAIAGGETWAVHGIRAARLGNQARQRTVIHVGVDFTVQQRLDAANSRLRVLALRAQQIDAFAASHPGTDPSRLHRDADKAVEETRALIVGLLPGLDADDGAVVEVKGEVHPGVVIDICRVEITIEKEMHACRFRLDKAAGRILIEPLSGGERGSAPDKAQARRGPEKQAEAREGAEAAREAPRKR